MHAESRILWLAWEADALLLPVISLNVLAILPRFTKQNKKNQRQLQHGIRKALAVPGEEQPGSSSHPTSPAPSLTDLSRSAHPVLPGLPNGRDSIELVSP